MRAILGKYFLPVQLSKVVSILSWWGLSLRASPLRWLAAEAPHGGIFATQAAQDGEVAALIERGFTDGYSVRSYGGPPHRANPEILMMILLGLYVT
jgi:hypothetical protein